MRPEAGSDTKRVLPQKESTRSEVTIGKPIGPDLPGVPTEEARSSMSTQIGGTP